MTVISELLIDCAALRHNLSVLKKHTRAKMCVMVKADAYGHGFGAVKAISDMADVFGVASNEEALILTDKVINIPILVAGGYSSCGLADCIKNNIAITVYSKSALLDIDRLAKKLNRLAVVHLKIDTGMHRLGIKPEEFAEYADFMSSLEYIKPEGVFTHFATADSDADFLEEQNKKFNQSTREVADGFCICRHAANSAALFRGEKYHYDMVRCGIATYGYEPFCNSCPELSPAISLRAEIVDIKKVLKEESVGYCRNYIATKDRVIAAVALGYGDGVPRQLSNCGKVVINNQLCDIIGNICMDLLMADITECKNVKIGDYAYVISEDKNDAGKVAGCINTIPYEIIAGITSRPKRIYRD